MRRLYIGIIMVMAMCLCEAFHLQGLSSVRQSVCANAPPCCPGHVCRAYQRTDASRPVAACATSIHARPMYAPGSSAQRRVCGSRRQAPLRARIPGRGRRVLDQNPFNRPNGISRFPNQLAGGQQWGRSDPRFRMADGNFPRQDRRDQRTQFSDRSRFDSFPQAFNPRAIPNRLPVSRSALSSRGFNDQLNTIASVSQEQRPFVPEGQFQFPQGGSSFSQSATSFPQGQRGFSGRSFRSSRGAQPFGRSTGSQSFGSSTGSQPFGSSTGSQPFGSNTGSQSFGSSTGSQPFGSSTGSQPFGSNTGSQSFGSSTGSQSFGRRSTFGQDNSFSQSQPVTGQRFTDGQDILNQLSQFPTDIPQGSSMTSGGHLFGDHSLGSLPQDGVPQPMLVEQPAVSRTPVPGSAGAQPPTDQSLGFLDLFSQGGFPQPMLVEQPAVSVSPISGPTGGQPLSAQTLGVLNELPPDGSHQSMLIEQPAVSVASMSGPTGGQDMSAEPLGVLDVLPPDGAPQSMLVEQPVVVSVVSIPEQAASSPAIQTETANPQQNVDVTANNINSNTNNNNVF